MAVLVDDGLELLDDDDCLNLLGLVSIGRVGVSVGGLPAIFPVNFVVDNGAIVFRTGRGTKLAAATDHAVVAFECDHVDTFDHTGWSVLVVGQAEVVTDPEERARMEKLHLVPWVSGGRGQFVRVPIEILSGRRITRDRSEETT